MTLPVMHNTQDFNRFDVSFNLINDRTNFLFLIPGKHTVYRMSAATAEEKEDWIKCVRQSISHNPFYDMLAVRKKKAQKTNVHHHSTNS